MGNTKRKFFKGANKRERQYSPAGVFTKTEIFQILEMYHHDGMNYNQIAKVFRVTLPTIKYIIDGPSYSEWVKEWSG